MPAWAAACFLISGAAALLYEIVWSKQLSYVLGNSLHAVATVVAAFLTGLALGAYVLGARLARRRDGARIYALLEVGIAVMGLLSMPLLRGLEPVIGALYRGLGGETPPMMLARFVLVFVLLLPPTVQMGATLPVLVAHFEYRRVGPALARLYAVNTLGAVAGSVLAGFVLLPAVGLTATTWIAAGMNLVAAALAASAARRSRPAAPAPAAPPPVAAPPAAPAAAATAPAPIRRAEPEVPPPVLAPRPRTAVAALFALSGLAALAFQIAWVRLFGLLFGSSVYSFAAVLAVYLAGLALGSALAGPWLRDAGHPGRAARLLGRLGGLQVALALATLAALYLFPTLPDSMYALGRRAAGDWTRLYLGELGLVATVLALPCVGFGAVFPLAARLLQSSHGGHATGLAFAVNTAGTLTGSLLAGFVLVPALGVQGTHLAAALLIGAVGLGTVAIGLGQGLTARARWPALAALAAGGALAAFAPPWDPAVMSSGVYRPTMARRIGTLAGDAAENPVRAAMRTERTLFYREGVHGSVYVGSDSSGVSRWLKIGGKIDASTGDVLTQVLLGTLPVSIAPEGARVAIIGLGSGITLSAALAAGAGAVEVTEIEPAVVEASRFFDEPGREPLRDPRVTLVLGDARTRLAHARARWDVIVSEPSNPWIAGVNNLFTVDFYRRVRERLAEDGVFCQWLQLYELSPETLASLLRSYLEVFPTGHAFGVWDTQDLLLVATPPGARLALERLRRPETLHQLRRARQIGAESVAAWYACPFDSLAALARGAPLNRDDRPIVEYRAGRDLFRVGGAGLSPGAAMIPLAPRGADSPLFASWPAEEWYRGRVRQLARSGHEVPAERTVEDLERRGGSALAEELRSVLEAQRRRGRAEEALQAARAARAAGRIDEARAALLRAVALDPGARGAWVMLAQVHRALEDAPAARAALARAVASEDSAERGYARLLEGSMDVVDRRPEDAVRAFREATRWIPREEQSWLLLARTLHALGERAAAAEACRQGIAAAATADRLRALLAELAGPG